MGAQNDTLLAGGSGIDTLNIGASFDDTGDGQITGIKNVVLDRPGDVESRPATEGFTITGSGGADTITGGLGADSISAGAGNDTINGAQSDALLDGGADTDTLNIGASFNDASNAQITGIENITLTAAVTLNLGDQTEGFKIIGSSGIDFITGGGGADRINAQGGNDTLTGGGGRGPVPDRDQHRHRYYHRLHRWNGQDSLARAVR